MKFNVLEYIVRNIKELKYRTEIKEIPIQIQKELIKWDKNTIDSKIFL